MPTRLRRKGNEEFPFYEVFEAWGKGLLVTEKFKQIVERFEPDVHQFLPVDIEQGGKVIAKRYFFYICNRLDTLAKDASIPPVGEDERYMPVHDGNDKKIFDTKKLAVAMRGTTNTRSVTMFQMICFLRWPNRIF